MADSSPNPKKWYYFPRCSCSAKLLKFITLCGAVGLTAYAAWLLSLIGTESNGINCIFTNIGNWGEILTEVKSG